MLSSIHPFGERSRHQRFWLTATAHTVGSAIGGALLGLVAGTLGWALTAALDPSTNGRIAIIAAVAVVACGFEATGRARSLPTRTRQVDENWIQHYRGWVYGAGFGVELGFGVSTIITTALVHVLVVTMIVVGSFEAATLIGATFGLVRGAIVFSTWRVQDPHALRQLHGRLDSGDTVSRRLGIAVLTIVSGASLLGAVL